MTRPTRVAIIGGGCGALSAAFELTQPHVRDQYDVTVYQMGWRLGGKGASSRGIHDRIEEHGLHLWMGFYENAFRQVRTCYEELQRDPDRCPLATFDDAFFPDPNVSIAHQDFLGDWDVWTVAFPEGGGAPGETLTDTNPYHLGAYLARALRLLQALLESTLSGEAKVAPWENEQQLLAQVEKFLALGQVLSLASVVTALRYAELLLGSGRSGMERQLGTLFERVQQFAHQQIENLTATSREADRLWLVLDLMLAAGRGMLRYGLLSDPRGFDAIDDYDLMDWLELNGASPDSTRSAFIRGSCYDLTFAYREGDPGQPAFAAGVGIRCALRMYFTYRGALFWKMRAGMGETVFAPLYEALRARGVRFEFFHRLDELKIADDDDGPHVSALHFARQALPISDYEPLMDVGGVPCWPSAPDFTQLADGERLRAISFESETEPFADTRTLHVGEDFDLVVLGISIASIPRVCGDLLQRDERWRDMVEQVTTVATQSAQVWLKPTMAELGYTQPQGNLSGFVTPFDTWADMSHLTPLENVPGNPGAVAYFCSALPEGQGLVDVRANLRRFMDQDLRHLWPAIPPEGFPEDHLAGGYAGQYTRANTAGSERYVQSLPGSTRFRISPLDRTYDNLTIAGDWTANSINAGCVEAAVISGQLAAHAIAGTPSLEDIIGFDQP